MSKFKREHRYIVLKVSDINSHLNDSEKDKLSAICNSINDGRAIENKPELKCVVVEHDWLEYEKVWQMIEERVTNQTGNHEK